MKKKCMSAGGVTSSSMKAVGRNVARANNQKGGKSVPAGYSGGGTVRGTGAAVKGKSFSGVY